MVDRLQEGRTPLHYAAALQGTTGGVNQLYSILAETGADENVVDVVSLLHWRIFNYDCFSRQKTFVLIVFPRNFQTDQSAFENWVFVLISTEKF